MKKRKYKDFKRYADSFKNFKYRYKLTDKDFAIIMTQYANSVDEQGASFFANKYGFSEYVFYLIKDYTLVFMLVDASVCVRIRDKAYRNQCSKSPSGKCTSAQEHYKDLLALRKEYLDTFSKDTIVKIAKEYANGTPLYDIAKNNKISPYTVRRLLAIALTNHLVDYETYQQINFRSMVYCSHLHNFNGYTAESLWNHSYLR